jgi:hypothetical protein
MKMIVAPIILTDLLVNVCNLLRNIPNERYIFNCETRRQYKRTLNHSFNPFIVPFPRRKNTTTNRKKIFLVFVFFSWISLSSVGLLKEKVIYVPKRMGMIHKHSLSKKRNP